MYLIFVNLEELLKNLNKEIYKSKINTSAINEGN